MKPAPSTHPHVDVLDGLRALAIVLVMWLHTWQLSWMNNTLYVAGVQLNWGMIPETGFLGVELFFFISGFCLFYPYARHLLEGASRPRLGTYIYRRAIKILPSYWLAVALLLFLNPPGFGSAASWAWQLGTHLTFLHNWFVDTKDTIDGVFWSLGVEVQFYVLFPLIAWAFCRKPGLTYVTMLLAAVAWRYGVAGHVAPAQAPFWLNELPGYLDFFANGMLAAHLLVAWRQREAPAWRPWVGMAVAIAAIGALGWLMHDLWLIRYSMPYWPTGWQVEHRAYLGLAFLALALGSAGALKPWQGLLANRVAVFLSTISYNLYIWHQVIARWLFNARWPAPRTQDPHLDPTWQWQYMLAAWASSILVAALITYAFERPLLKHGPRGLWVRWRARGSLPLAQEAPVATP